MPFREVSVMDQKREFVVFAAAEGVNFRELCRRFGVSPTTGYKWLNRHRREGLAGLEERSRRPRSCPLRTAGAVEAKVLEVRAEQQRLGRAEDQADARGSRRGGHPGGEHDHRDHTPPWPPHQGWIGRASWAVDPL